MTMPKRLQDSLPSITQENLVDVDINDQKKGIKLIECRVIFRYRVSTKLWRPSWIGCP
jgi:hypothetical protein